jgi:hypothetical protein
MALGITTATRNFSAGVATAGVAGAVPHALKTSESATTNVKNHAIFFIFFSLTRYGSSYATTTVRSKSNYTDEQAPPVKIQFSRSKGFVNAEGARTLETVATKTRIVKTYGIITAISEGMGIPRTWIHN